MGQIDAAAFCVTGVALSASPAGFVWQAWTFHYLHRCQRKLGDEVGQIDAAAFCVTGVALSASPAGFVWQAWRFRYLRVDLRGRRDAFGNLRLDLRGRRGA